MDALCITSVEWHNNSCTLWLLIIINYNTFAVTSIIHPSKGSSVYIHCIMNISVCSCNVSVGVGAYAMLEHRSNVILTTGIWCCSEWDVNVDRCIWQEEITLGTSLPHTWRNCDLSSITQQIIHWLAKYSEEILWLNTGDPWAAWGLL